MQVGSAPTTHLTMKEGVMQPKVPQYSPLLPTGSLSFPKVPPKLHSVPAHDTPLP